MKDVIILGGPNGAGKTTAAQLVVPHAMEMREFVNADEIARGLLPFTIEDIALTAGRIMIERFARWFVSEKIPPWRPMRRATARNLVARLQARRLEDNPRLPLAVLRGDRLG